MDFSKLEKKILKSWEKEGTFTASLKARAKAPRFVFFEGPPTANGKPGIHHALMQTFKDAVCRYKTMRGFLVERQAGWDTHGLPVELEVEKELGLRSKQDIERYGIARFNARCKKSVWRYKTEWEKWVRRIGYWLDLERPYITYTNDYIETLWSIFKHVWQKGLLYEDHKVVPWCTRCGSTLSSHEVALGYESVTENSVYVKFKVVGEKDTYILGWTTTPWTLPGNVALAVGKDIGYVKVRIPQNGRMYILAKAALSNALLDPYEIMWEGAGKELVGLVYKPLFNIPETRNDKTHKVYDADFVTTGEGTGIVHTAVMYGEDDYQLGAKADLPKVHTVDEQGRFLPIVPAGLAGMLVKAKETEKKILSYLDENDLLLREENYTHDYPFCWRCKTPLLYYAKKSWFIRISKLRQTLLSENEKINWTPEHLQHGRFGEWLRELKDWAISRERYWGTPLPIWRCVACGEIEVVGSIEELGNRSRLKNRYILLRHGEARSNVEEWASCLPEKRKNPLTAKGRTQAQTAAKTIARYKPDLVVTSPLERARETAKIVAKKLHLDVIVDDRLQELGLGTFNTRPIDEFHEFLGYKPEHHWTRRPVNGETWKDVRKRMIRAVQDFEKKHEGKTIVLVGHADPLFVLLGTLSGASSDDFSASYKKTYPAYSVLRSGKTFPYPKNGIPLEVPHDALPLNVEGELDLHRPYVDGLEFPCKKCQSRMHRVPEVADVWFDSGAMPWASQNIDLRKQVSEKRYPADFICEAIDQTRGWFYTLLAIASLLGRERPFKNVISVGHVLDKNGKKMSKSMGNIINPWDMVERYGADAVRWYFFTVNQPGDPKRFDEQDVKQASQRFVGTLYNVLVFWRTYAPKREEVGGGVTGNTVLDKWIFSRLATTISEVIKHLDAYDVVSAARLLETFVVDDLSNWYIRRSRERFQRPETKKDLKEAAATLSAILNDTAKLAAPLVPFLAEEIFRHTSRNASVHLALYPRADMKVQNLGLEEDMAKLRQAAAAAHAARRNAGIRVRQPLASLSISKDHAPRNIHRDALFALFRDELNVKEIKVGDTLPEYAVVLDTDLTPALRAEGVRREVIRIVQDLRKEAGLKPQDHVRVRVSIGGSFSDIFSGHEHEFQRAVGARNIVFGPPHAHEKIWVTRTVRVADGPEVWAALVK